MRRWLSAYVIGALAVLALCALIACAVLATQHLDDGVVLNAYATWGGAFGAVFGGCAIYLGFLTTAIQQRRDREERQLRDANHLLRRFRIEPMLAFFIQLIDYGHLGPRKVVLPPELAALHNGNPIFDYDPKVFAAMLAHDSAVPPATAWIYGDALNVGFDYLTELELLVQKGAIDYSDLGALCYFLEHMRDPAFLGGTLLTTLRENKYEAVLSLLARDTRLIKR